VDAAALTVQDGRSGSDLQVPGDRPSAPIPFRDFLTSGGIPLDSELVGIGGRRWKSDDGKWVPTIHLEQTGVWPGWMIDAATGQILSRPP
jgi:hypothetical protein